MKLLKVSSPSNVSWLEAPVKENQISIKSKSYKYHWQ